jgi:hypothetical protein
MWRRHPVSNKNELRPVRDFLEVSRNTRFRGYTPISIPLAKDERLRVRVPSNGLRSHRQAAGERDEATVRRRNVSQEQKMGRPSGTPGLGHCKAGGREFGGSVILNAW